MKDAATTRFLFAVLLLATSSSSSSAMKLSDRTGTFEIVESHQIKRPFRWQSTKSAYDWVKISADALGPDPIADLIGVIGLAITVPLTAVAIPFDIMAFPFRWNQIVKVRIRGKALDPHNDPVRSAKGTLMLDAYYPDSDIVSHFHLHQESEFQTDSEGSIDLPTDLSFGPNTYVSVSLVVKDRGMAQYYWITRKGRELTVITHDFPKASRVAAEKK